MRFERPGLDFPCNTRPPVLNYHLMSDTHRDSCQCPRCGARLAPDAPDGLCPRCLVALSFATDTDIPGDPANSDPSSTTAAPSLDEIARLFPQLEILTCLGRGGMGVVYQCRQPKLDRLVALKILTRGRQDGSAAAAFAERFAREARALARLNHPNIVAVHEYGEAGGYPFLLMEYVDGLTLRQLIQRGKLAPEEALTIVPRICEALQFAHQKGIIHRDIKPENILLDRAGQVKITDFGIAKMIAPGASDYSLTGAKEVVGTPYYMAPEQVERPQWVDHRADIYSLGVVFYEMLTGELPLGKFQPPSHKVRIDVRLDEVVLRALAKEPERRYQQANEVKTDVETIAGIPASTAPNCHPEDQTTRSARDANRSMVSSRFSRMAILGVVWALLFAVNWVWSYTPPGWMITQALRNALGHWAAGLLQGPLAIVAFAAPVGVTLLGGMAMSGIRRSGSRSRELALALADTVLFPLLLLDSWLVWLCRRVGAAASGGAHPESIGAATWGVILGLILDAILVAWLWRRVQKPLPPLPASLAASEEAEAPERWWHKLVWKMMARAALIGVIQLCLLETILQAAVHRPESTGELWYMALLSSSLAVMVWAAWPLRRTRSPAPLVVAGTLVLFGALCGLDAYYTLRIRPNLGLYEEDDWVSLHPGFQWGWRQGTAKALWSKPPAQPFAPAVEMTIPLDERHPVALLDLDTGRQLSRDTFAADDDAALAWAQAEKLDLAMVSRNIKITAMALGMRAACVPVPNVVKASELTSQAAVNFWVLDRKPSKTVADLPLYKGLTDTYVFHTREGGIGFLEFAGPSENPPGVKVRWRLVPGDVSRKAFVPTNSTGHQIEAALMFAQPK
jgi:serine/threonine protein kinase